MKKLFSVLSILLLALVLGLSALSPSKSFAGPVDEDMPVPLAGPVDGDMPVPLLGG